MHNVLQVATQECSAMKTALLPEKGKRHPQPYPLPPTTPPPPPHPLPHTTPYPTTHHPTPTAPLRHRY